MKSTVMKDVDLMEAKRIVGGFSRLAFTEEPDNLLAESLVIAVAKDVQNEDCEETLEEQWKALFSPVLERRLNSKSTEEILLDKPAKDLAQAYKDFLKQLPKGHEFIVEDGPPDLRSMIDAMRVMIAKQRKDRENTKGGRMKTLFGKVCAGLDDHKDLFAMIPSGDKYICLLTGSVSLIVKATVNYGNIAESVSSALDDLSDDAKYWRELLGVNTCNARMKEYVTKLYMTVFEFLINIMTKWMKSPIARICHSFDGNFFKDEIEFKRNKIEDLGRRLQRQIDLDMKRQVLQMPTQAEVVRIMALSQANFRIELESRNRELGEIFKKTLLDEVINYFSARDSVINKISDDERFQAAQVLPTTMKETTEAISSVYLEASYAKKQVRLNALRYIRQYEQDEHIISLIDQAQGLNIHMEIFNRIQDWNSAPTSQSLWIQGSFQAPTPSQYTLLSAYIISIAQRASVPIISYFCQHDVEPYTCSNDKRSSVSQSGMISMIYTLINQLSSLIPDDFRSHSDFSSTSFQSLDGTDSSIPHAISLLKNLLSVGPYMLFCVVDGLQILEDPANMGFLRAFIDVIRSADRSNDDESPRTIKTLFTTDGFTEALICLKGNERLDVLDFTNEDNEGDGIEMAFF